MTLNAEGQNTIGKEGATGKNSEQTPPVGQETPKQGDKASGQLPPVDFIKLDVTPHPSFVRMQQTLGKQISDKDFALSYRGGLLEDDSFNARNIVLFPLKYSKEEIQNLNSMFSNGLVLLSDNATEENFKVNASQSSIIHLSTHSFLHKDQPLIIFSQDENEKED